MPKEPLKSVARASGIGLQLTITIFVGAYLGDYLDDRFPVGERRIFTLLLTLAATGVAIYNVIRQLRKEDE